MRLSRDEEAFLRHWMYDEVHYQHGPGAAKLLQVQHRVAPADLAVVIAAAFPDLAEQQAAGLSPPPSEAVSWPWSDAALQERLRQAQALLAGRGTERPVDNRAAPSTATWRSSD
ncbi:MAG TPA: hypothetical protein VFA18_23990 [Gemmataceae bacterium]|nr:hypothetical protein [Gemmataceae bacterium]